MHITTERADGAIEPVAAATLPDERRIVVRPVLAADEDALFELYDQLDATDRWWRFRSAYRPPSSFFREMAQPERGGGARFVAELTSPSGTRIIGEAGYVGLANGNGELSMLVGRRWRGWLVPLLLHELLVEAATLGVPNLEADVATQNGAMLKVLHGEGAVVMSHDRWSGERMLVGTAGGMPTWAGFGRRPRVLVEAPGARLQAEDDLQTAGFAVLSCHGPRRQRGCSAVAGGSCALAATADIILLRQPADDDPWRALAAAHARVHPGVPVVLRPMRASTDPTTCHTLVLDEIRSSLLLT